MNKIVYDANTGIETTTEVQEVVDSTTLKILEIEKLKNELSDTDYQAIKHSEGQISELDYAPIKEQRQLWRNRINELEEELRGDE